MILHPLQFDDLLGAVPHPAAVLEPGGRVIRVNEGWRAWWARATGDPDVVGLGVNFVDACEQEGRAETVRSAASSARRAVSGVRAVASGDLAAAADELDWELADGMRRVRLTVTPVGPDHHTVLVTIIDLTSEQAPAPSEPAVASSATGRSLPDRASFLDLTEHSAALAARHGFSVAVVAICIDGLDEISAHDGPRSGADLRRVLVARLQAAVRPADVVADVGRTSFLVLLPDLIDGQAAQPVASRLVRELARPVQLGERRLEVRARAGVAGMPVGGRAEAVVEHAEDALERARLSDGEPVALVNADGWTITLAGGGSAPPPPRVVDLAERPIAVADPGGIVDEHLLTYFQPIVDLDDRSIVAAEALLRWRHPHYGVLSAGEFLGLELNRSHRATLAEQALACAAEAWADVRDAIAGPAPHLFLNLTPDQLRNRHSLDRLGHLLVATGIPADDVVVEITEAAMDAPFGELIDALADLRQLGVRLALDDFGAGYSSLGRLRHLPVDVVKVDRQMTQGIDTDRRARQMLASVLTMARELGLETIVEGCETESEARALAQLGVRFVQGFALGVPMPAEDLLRRVQGRSLVSVG